MGKGERGIRQRRYWEHRIRDEQDLERCVDYVHVNPVRHGHAARTADWPYSTFHRYVAKDWLSADWGMTMNAAGNFGERNDPPDS